MSEHWKIYDVVDRLRGLDLKRATDDDVLSLVREVRRLELFGFDIPIGIGILRGRRSPQPFPYHWREADISYVRDRDTVAPYNRASFRGTARFYGSSVTGNHLGHSRDLVVEEISPVLRGISGAANREFVIIGKWVVTEPLNVIAIVQDPQRLTQNFQLSEFNRRFESGVEGTDDYRNAMLHFARYMATEFSKDVAPDEPHRYKISAAFATRVIDMGADGIVYPSVRSSQDSVGLNIALSTAAVDRKLRFSAMYADTVLRLCDGRPAVIPYLAANQAATHINWQSPSYLDPAQTERELQHVSALRVLLNLATSQRPAQ